MSIAESWKRIIAWHEDHTVPGKVRLNEGEVGPQYVVATIWGEFLDKLAEDLEAGLYVYVEEEEIAALLIVEAASSWDV